MDEVTGKTTRLIEEAISKLADLPPDAKIYFTGAHTQWVHRLLKDFKEAELIDVEFIPYQSVLNGRLRGCKGLLLIDDQYDFTPSVVAALVAEAKYLEHRTIIPKF